MNSYEVDGSGKLARRDPTATANWKRFAAVNSLLQKPPEKLRFDLYDPVHIRGHEVYGDMDDLMVLADEGSSVLVIQPGDRPAAEHRKCFRRWVNRTSLVAA